MPPERYKLADKRRPRQAPTELSAILETQLKLDDLIFQE